MEKRKATFAGHAWSMMRMALLWARKGGALRRKLMLDLHHALKRLRDASARPGSRLRYGELYRHGEREMSFDETPMFRFHLKGRRPPHQYFLPCMNPPEVSDDDDDHYYFHNDDHDEMARECAAKDDEEAHGRSKCEEAETAACSSIWGEQDDPREGIDVKAEEFIERFYQQMKLQRQISLLQYNEMLYRGMS